MTDPTWQRVQRSSDRETLRLAVPGGWLYLVNEFGDLGGIMGQTLAFVPKQQGGDRRVVRDGPRSPQSISI